MVLAGGIDSLANVLDSAELYDVSSDSWSTISPLPASRCDSASLVAYGSFFVLGGIDASATEKTEIFRLDTSLLTWTTETISLPLATKKPFSLAFDYHTSAGQTSQIPADDDIEAIMNENKKLATTYTYSCDDGFELYDASNALIAGGIVTATCQADTTWSVSHTLGSCQWAECLEPVFPPNANNLVLRNWNGLRIPIGEVLNFTCRDSMTMTPSFEVASCDTNNAYTTPASWSVCQSGLTCPALPAVNPGGNATLKTYGYSKRCLDRKLNAPKVINPTECPQMQVETTDVDWTAASDVTTEFKFVSLIADLNVVAEIELSYELPQISLQWGIDVNGTSFDDSDPSKKYHVVFAAPTSQKQFTFTVSHAHREDLDLCLFNVRCQSGTDRYSSPSTWSGDFDPETEVLVPGSEVVYTCPNETSFVYANSVHDSFNFTCDDFGSWSPSENDMPGCALLHCTEPPSNMPSTYKLLAPWTEKILINDTLELICKDGMRFNDEFDNRTLIVKCLPDDQYDTPATWPVCQPEWPCSDNLPALPVSGSAKLINRGVRLGPCIALNEESFTPSPKCPIIRSKTETNGNFSRVHFRIDATFQSHVEAEVIFSVPLTSAQFESPLDLKPLSNPNNDRSMLATFSYLSIYGYTDTFVDITLNNAERTNDICVYDIFCQDELLTTNLTDPESRTFLMESEVAYRCPFGHSFDLTGSDDYANEIVYKCQIDGQWNRSLSLPPCESTSCQSLPDHPDHLKAVNFTEGVPIEYDSSIAFVCEDGLRFEESVNSDEFDLAFCRSGDNWDVPIWSELLNLDSFKPIYTAIK